MLKYIAFVFLLVLCVYANYAQTEFYLGGKTGFNISHIRKIENPTNYNNKINLGSNTGFVFRAQIHSNIAVQTGMNFSQKGQRWTNKTDTINYYQKFGLNYLEFPLLGVVSFGNEKIRALVYLGTYFGYWTGAFIQKSTQENKITTNKENYDYNFTTNENKFDFGIASGIGCEFKVGNGWLDFTIRHNAGLLSIYKDDKLYNCNLNISIGYIYNVGTLVKKEKTQ